jgi:hypothetical protein
MANDERIVIILLFMAGFFIVYAAKIPHNAVSFVNTGLI